MLKKQKPLEVPVGNPFLNDKLNREELIENLSKLLMSYTDPFVFAINSPWGTGKTSFVKLWKSYLEEQCGTSCIYFSAWENDILQDPFTSIMGELQIYIQSISTDNPMAVQNWEKVKKIGGKILTKALPSLIKGATFGVLDVEDGIEEAIAVFAENQTEALINSYVKDKSQIEIFRKTLHELVAYLSTDGKPLVIFIDELDRCRPLYAITLLEQMKHFFNTDGIVFILSIDKSQLSKSIQSQYGDIDADNYLRRFIDLEYILPSGSKENFYNALFDKFDFVTLLRKKSVASTQESINNPLWALPRLLDNFDLSLRQIEQLISHLSIIFRIMDPSRKEYLFPIIFHIVFKHINTDLYEQFIKKQVSKEDVLNFFKQNNPAFFTYANITGCFVEACVNGACLDKEQYLQLVYEYKLKIEHNEHASEQYKKANYIHKILIHDTSSDTGFITLATSYAIEMVNMTSTFNLE